MMTEVKSYASFFSSCLPSGNLYSLLNTPESWDYSQWRITQSASWIPVLLLITYNNGRSLGKMDNGESGLMLRPGWRSCNIPQKSGIFRQWRTLQAAAFRARVT